MPRVVHVTTVSDSLIFLDGLVQHLGAAGFEVHVVSSPGERLTQFGRAWNVPTYPLDMPRKVSPLGDLVSASELTGLFSRLRPDIVHAHTPKGGLLGMLSARAAGVPLRLYQMRGLPFVTAKGTLRGILTATEKVSCAIATQVICQSPSLREVALAEHLAPADKLTVILKGSNGVDSAGRFNPARFAGQRGALREAAGIPPNALVFLFVGRLVRDKGVVELLEAFTQLAERLPDAWLWCVGPFEPRDPVPSDVKRALEAHPRIRLEGYANDPSAFYAGADVVVLPTYREGFPNVPLEAAAMGLPVIATRVPGCVDAVEDNVTGTLVPAQDVRSLSRAMLTYAADPSLRQAHGRAGRARVERDFARERIWEEVVRHYRKER